MVELAALEKRYGATHRGFESLPLRQIEIGTFSKAFQVRNNKFAPVGGFFVASERMKKVRILTLRNPIFPDERHKNCGTFVIKKTTPLV